MPTYEYTCTSCGEHLEVVQSFRDEPLSACPSCGGPLRKVFGSIGVVFKGSGFYKTDSRSASKSAKAEKADTSGEAAAKSESSASKSSDGASSSEGSGSSSKSGDSGSSKKPAPSAEAS